MKTLADMIAEDARLCILKELSQQTDGRLNDKTLRLVLEVFGINRSRDYVRTQLRALNELGAVRLSDAGTVMIAALTAAGRDHVERRGIIEGVARPSDEG